MKRNICFFIGTLCDGGAERVVSILSKEFSKTGYNVNILTYYDKADFYEIDSSVTRTKVCLETNSTNIFKNIKWIHKYFKKFDVVYSFLAPFNIIAIVANFRNKTRLIVADRNDPRKVPSNFLVRTVRNFLYRFSDHVVLQTEHNKNYFSKSVQKKSSVIFNPINKNMFDNLLSQRSHKIKEIVTVGRLMPQKNQLALLKAFSIIHNKYPDYVLKIFGEGPERDNLQKTIVELKLSECAFLMGNDKSVLEKINCASLFVLSSFYEGMPNALIEAMCLGLVCISTRVSGATELIENGVNGFLVDDFDAESISTCMESVLNLGDAEQAKIKLNATKLKEKLSIDNISSHWLGLAK